MRAATSLRWRREKSEDDSWIAETGAIRAQDGRKTGAQSGGRICLITIGSVPYYEYVLSAQARHYYTAAMINVVVWLEHPQLRSCRTLVTDREAGTATVICGLPLIRSAPYLMQHMAFHLAGKLASVPTSR